MNQYYQKESFYNSNNDVLKVKIQKGAVLVPSWKKSADKIIALLTALVMILTNSRALRIVQTITTAICLIGLVGIVGAIEQGTLGLLSGFTMGLGLILTEALCLRLH